MADGIGVDVKMGDGVVVDPGVMDGRATKVEDALGSRTAANPPSARLLAKAPITMSKNSKANNPPEIILRRSDMPSHLPGHLY